MINLNTCYWVKLNDKGIKIYNTYYEDLSLSTWTTSISKGDVITATIDSASVGTKLNCIIYATASS